MKNNIKIVRDGRLDVNYTIATQEMCWFSKIPLHLLSPQLPMPVPESFT